MWGKKIRSLRRLAVIIGVWLNRKTGSRVTTYGEDECSRLSATAGYFAVYVGEERQRFVIPTHYLSHPLFKMVLEKSHDDETQKKRLVIPCSVATFREVVCAVNCCNGMFDLGPLIEQLI